MICSGMTVNKYIFSLLFISWLFLGITLLWYEGFKMCHALSKKDKKDDWILYVLFVILSVLLIITNYKIM